MPITEVQTAGHNNASTSSTTCVTTLPSNAAGNLVVVCVGYVDVSGTVTATVTDNKGNTFTASSVHGRNNTSQYSVQQFNCSGVLASGSTVTYTATLSTGAAFTDIKVTEYHSSNGAWTSSAVDTVMAAAQGSSTALATAAATPATDNCLIVTYGGCNSGVITAGSGFTLRGTGVDGLGMADLVQTTKASKAGLLTSTIADQWVITAVAYKDVVASGFDQHKASGFLGLFA